MEQRMSVIRTNGTDAKSKPRGRPLKEKENPAADVSFEVGGCIEPLLIKSSFSERVSGEHRRHFDFEKNSM